MASPIIHSACIALAAFLCFDSNGARGQSSRQKDPDKPRFRESVTVERVLTDVRVVDDAGNAILGLRPQDFRVKVGGKRVTVESALWIAGNQSYAEGLDPEQAVESGGPVAPPGRLVVFLFQKDFESSRMRGLLRMIHNPTRALLGSLRLDDRVAVLSFDTHLKLWQDFTNDQRDLRRAIEHSMLFESHPYVRAGPSPSLAAYFDVFAGRRAATPEKALQVLADALQHLPGAKSLVFFGWGMGRFSSMGTEMIHDYGPARRALVAARVSVFSLDITDADYHSLEVGLQQVAADTGGFYARTHIFPDLAVRRVTQALSGYYALSFEAPETRDAITRPRSLDVDLVSKKGRVLARSSLD